VDKVVTGIVGLDKMIQGGFPKGRIILLCGGPGSGKTCFSMQFLMKGIEQNKKCIYISLEEPLKTLKENMLGFGWDLNKYSEEGRLFLLDSSHLAYYEAEKPYLEKPSFIDVINEVLKHHDVERLVLDPINSLTVQLPSAGQKRVMVGKIFGLLREKGITSVVTMETEPSSSGFYMEKFLADGVISLERTINRSFKLIKTLRIEKMRGVDCDDQPRKYAIKKNGIKVYDTEPVLIE